MPESGETWNQFELLERLGSGGMGEVFLARDTSLDRKVAVKFLPEPLKTDLEARERFLREAKSAAGLDHPYICKIYEVGDAKGTPFIAMEYVEGETLHDLLSRRGPLAVPELARIAAEAAEAIDAAHRKEVIHRDLKSANVMVAPDGHVKVMDFGLARTMSSKHESRVDTFSGRLTSSGSTPGTVAYMSPEQVRGEPLDARSDVFSLGVVLYEMATGKLPFSGATSGLTYDAILNRGALSPRQLNPDLPLELEQAILKALEKERENRYQSAREMVVDLRRMGRIGDSSGATPVVEPSSRRREAGRSWRLWGAVAAVVMALVVLTVVWRAPEPQIQSIDSLAVLPFENVRDDPTADYLSDGIAESLINRLSQAPELQVMARSTSFRYRGSDVDPREVGRELGVRAVLTGRVVQQGDNLNVQAELVDVENGTQIWGEQYQEPIADLVAVQNQLARQISQALRLELTEVEVETSSEAYRAYLLGRHFWNRRTNEDLKRATEQFRKALEEDPDFALAYVGLADALMLLGGQFYGEDEAFSPETTLPEARSAALEALRHDETLGAAHATLGFLDFLAWEWESAEREFRRALELDPDYTSAHQWYSQYLSLMERFDEALREQERALELEPDSPLQNRMLGFALLFAGDYRGAARQLEATLALDPSYSLTREFLSFAYWLAGRDEEALAAAQEVDPDFARFYELLRQGEKDAARELVASSEELGLSRTRRSVLHAFAGDADRAFQTLERAFDIKDPELPVILHQNLLKSIQDDPRLAELRRRVGLPP